MSYYQRRQDGPTPVLCDKCGFTKHHRPSVESDSAFVRVEDAPGWTWEPSDNWCWAPTWSGAEFHPCDECGENANAHWTMSQCAPIGVR